MSAQCIDTSPMRKIHVMDCAVESLGVDHTWRMPGKPIAKQGKDGWFIECCEAPYAISVAPRYQRRVVAIPPDNVSIQPSTFVLERLRQIPMVQAKPRLDASSQQTVDQPVIEGQPGLVRIPAPFR